MKKAKCISPDRRDFIRNVFSMSAFCCFSKPLIYNQDKSEIQTEIHKFQNDSGLTAQQVYDFAFKNWYIPAMTNLMNLIGKDKFLEMLKQSSDLIQTNGANYKTELKERTFKMWSDNSKAGMKGMNRVLSYEIIKDDSESLEFKCTECLWAKTFREAKASEIGYAGVCYQDYAMTKAFNPNLILTREKTLMQGDDCCNFKWTFKS
jgi:hypothetical protein